MELQGIRERLLAVQSRVNVETFRAANPLSPLIGIDVKRMEVNVNGNLGKGGFGSVKSGTITDSEGKTHRVAIKTAIGECGLVNEGMVGGNLVRAYANVNDEASLLAMYGFPLIVLPFPFGEKIFQEQIDGMNLLEVLNKRKEFFANSFVGDPQKAIELVAGLVLGLHGLHWSGKIHHDLKLENVMLEKRKVRAKIEAKTKEILGKKIGQSDEQSILNAWRGLTLEEQEALKVQAEASLPDEEKYQYVYRIIDFGLAANPGEVVNNGSPNAAPEVLLGRDIPPVASSYDMYTLGTILPSLFFGYKGAVSPKLGKKAMDFRRTYVRINLSAFMLRARSYGESGIRQHILQELAALNAAMQRCTGKSYSPDELAEIAQVTADCLSLDPNDRPTALEVYKRLTKLLGRRDHRDGYRVEELSAKQRSDLGLTLEELGASDLTPEKLNEIRRLRRERERDLQDEARLRRERERGLRLEV
jgi:serine/threonine protein kinase